MSRPSPSWRPLAGLLGAAGTLHLAVPHVFTPLVPRRLGAPRAWVLWSGVAELACAAGLLAPASRPRAARAAAALLVAVFPGNVRMALTAHRSRSASRRYRAACWARLPLQVPLVWWAWRVARPVGARA